MKNQTLVYAQFLTEGGEKFSGSASFPIPKDWKNDFSITHMTPAILTSSGEPVDAIRLLILNTINLYAHLYASQFSSEQFKEKRKEKILELCAKFNVSP